MSIPIQFRLNFEILVGGLFGGNIRLPSIIIDCQVSFSGNTNKRQLVTEKISFRPQAAFVARYSAVLI